MPFDAGDNEPEVEYVQDVFEWFGKEWRAGSLWYGAKIVKALLLTKLGCPDLDGLHTSAEHNTRGLLQLSRTQALFDLVLENYNAKILADGGFYSILEPRVQTAEMPRRRYQRVARNLAKLEKELQHINTTLLDPSERKRRNDELASASSMRALIARHRKPD